MPAEHMSVDAVVGGGDLAVREPGPVLVGDAAGRKRLAAPAQAGGRGLVPVELGGMVRPEFLKGAERERKGSILGMGGHGERIMLLS
ncbi:hypothetical protein I7I50_11063 [Histoplasma capsulatum G186AR]|uniref:Uncharacterized protein n=1 Tax=Ajellomyces capsulatus TaxID=5037 RepID=A0A8H7Z4N6_AJECA|nr:hypothetical protein I7I52_02302 [Histoplasma capsulatum]QSS69688.1 hypothetical protein I7I50_11063 [Histoplasma capsulatum G186AR]